MGEDIMKYESLCTSSQRSDIIDFYKIVFKSEEPTIIDLVGNTGAGKTTFCQ